MKSLNSGFVGSSFFKYPNFSVKFGKNCHLRGSKYIHLGNNVTIGDNVILTAWDHFRDRQKFNPHISIGSGSMIGDYCNISSINSIIIGDNVLFGRFITIIDHSHGSITNNIINKIPWDRNLESKGGGSHWK